MNKTVKRVKNAKRVHRSVRRFNIIVKTSFFIAIMLTSLFIGQKLFTKTVSASEQVPRCKYYTSIRVLDGDTLTSIADRYISDEYKSKNDYIDEVRQMNYLDSECRIHAGDYIIVPYYETRVESFTP